MIILVCAVDLCKFFLLGLEKGRFWGCQSGFFGFFGKFLKGVQKLGVSGHKALFNLHMFCM
jgi:hypothetical protein